MGYALVDLDVKIKHGPMSNLRKAFFTIIT